MSHEKLRDLRCRLGEIADVSAAISLLRWDQETYMPPKAASGRGQQLATLSAIGHRLLTAPELGRILHELNDSSDQLDADDAKLVSETLYDVTRAAKLPESFVKEFEETSSQAYEAWVTARKESQFAVFQPHLEKIVGLVRQKADYLGYADSPYDALVEDFERGMTASELHRLFTELAPRLSALVARIVAKPEGDDPEWLKGNWEESARWDMSVRVLRDMGYNFAAGRQDRSVHPFTMEMGLEDVRVTTRLSPDRLFDGLTASLHEGGHALYDQGFQEKDRRTTLAAGPSLGIHESQSRLWENMIGRSLPFWNYYTPMLREHFPSQLAGVEAEDVYRALNRVHPSLIRVEADECTYNLHIIVRFEIERALIEGQAKVSEIPEFWNAKITEYLGLAVPDDARGCLQDIHWSHGAVGYFPTYALGNLYAAQLFEAILRDIPDLWSHVEHGDFRPLLSWLRTHIHQYGRRKTAGELVRDASGQTPSNEPFLTYLTGKYGELYGL
ncbi:MAG: carboxypeptidase M32 [Candidatus Hydrogenedentes bacterium]|nr:carboxypeptidase M32 [Candidatus Hydrogenedentota bacterium]